MMEGCFFYFAHIRDELICTPLGGEQCGGEVIFNINPFRVFAVHSVLDDFDDRLDDTV